MEKEMVKFIQINLNRCSAAQDLMLQTTSEYKVDVLLISEQNKNSENGGWFIYSRKDAVILILARTKASAKMIERGNGYVRCILRDYAFYSCYCSPNSSIEGFQADLEQLEDSARQWTGPMVIAGDFKSKSWSNDPEDKRGQLLDELMISLDLVVINQPGIATFEGKASPSVLDFAFLRPAQRRNLRNLEEELLSDHMYVYFEIEHQKPDFPQTLPKGWAIKGASHG